ncbi:MAG TPA: toxin TcdB middle/N-terminal domain-containing protein [Patescibacteria group bacterium]|nr:toxin TcdB middle/N-terminal domain-containing protein [Patescibacteria group bacterium]
MARGSGGDPFQDGPPAPSGAPAIDPALGIATVTLAFEVPPARRGLAPDLALRYTSVSGRGNAGLGFSLSIGSIERSTRLGPPRYDDTDTYVLNLGGDSLDLVPIDGGSTRFRTVLHSGYLVERLPAGPFGAGSTFWMARGPDGRRYRFGAIAGADGTSQVRDFKWGLDRVEDSTGNVMTIDWTTAGLNLYATRIAYAAHPASGLPAANLVELCWEARGDRTMSAAGEVLTHRLRSLRTFASGKPARSWTLEYATPGDIGSSLGTCRTDDGSILPSQPSGPPGPTPNPLPSPTRPGRPVVSSALRLRTSEPGGAAALPPIPSPLPPYPSLLAFIHRGDGAGGYLPPLQYAFGADRVPGWPAAGASALAPPMPFVYAQGDVVEDTGLRVADLNRDGLPDLIHFEGDLLGLAWSTSAAVWLNTGTAFVYSAAWTTALQSLVNPSDPSRSAWFVVKRGSRDRAENGARFVDVNDDGYPDVVRETLWFGTGLRKGVFLNTGSGFTGDVAGSWHVPDEPFIDLHDDAGQDVAADRGVRFADVDADGRADMLVSRAEWGGPAERRVWRHDGAGWTLDPRWILPDEPFIRHIPHGASLDMGVRLVELNGDSFPDLLMSASIDGFVRTTAWINSGRPDGVNPTWTTSGRWGNIGPSGEHFVQIVSSGDGASYDHGLRAADVDGDGRTDLIAARQWNAAPPEKILYTADDYGGWSERSFGEFPGLFVVRPAGEGSRDQGVRLVDLDGDGGLDFVQAASTAAAQWRPNRAWQGRLLLASYSNGLGGRTALTYVPAPHTGLVDGGGPAALPFPLAVVGAVTVSDGLGGAATTRYAYDGGFYHHRTRDFRGFRKATQTSADSLSTIETSFAQQPWLPAAPLRGAPARRVTRRVADGAVLARTDWTYDESDGLPPLRHPLRREETALYDWTTTDPSAPQAVKRTATSWTWVFDDASNPDRPLLRREERQEGDLDDPADDRIVCTDYASATAAAADGAAGPSPWILEAPWHTLLLDAAGQVVSESWTGLDGQPPGTSPVRGLTTRLERRGGPPGPEGTHGPGDPQNPVVSRTYDARGELATETDPLGRTRRIDRGVADASYTFPERETNALGQISERRFDPRTGQILLSTDPNGRSVGFEYDGFGRRLAEWGPYDTREQPTVAYLYQDGRLPARVGRFSRETSGIGSRAGTDGCLESAAYFDGLGRLLEITSESPGGRVVTRAIVRDAAGRVMAESEPFAAPAGDTLVPPGDAPFARHYEYDAAGRLTRATNARGEAATESHEGWTTLRVDAAGHQREITQDAFGRVAQVREFEGVAPAVSPRPPATYAYDAEDRLTALVDPMGVRTALGYDALGHRVLLDDPHTGRWSYVFDLQGNLAAETDPQRRTTTVQYDALDRLVGKTLGDGRQLRWTWDEGGAAADAVGRITSIVDPTGTRTLSYDALGRTTDDARRVDGVEYATHTDWDAMGRIVSRRFPGGVQADYHYDAGGQLSSVAPYVTRIDHNERGQMTRVVHATGARADHLWDPATGRPTGLVVIDSSGATVEDLAWTTDADGMVTVADDRALPGPPAPRTYGYDARHRLVRAQGPWGSTDYAYDDAGTMTHMGQLSLMQDDPLHPQRVTRTSAGATLSYDAAGNLLVLHAAGGTRMIGYDSTGRLTRLIDTSRMITVTSDYDAEGRLLRETTDQSGTRSVFLLPSPEVEVSDGRITVQIAAGGLRLASVEAGGRAVYPVADPSGSLSLVLDDRGLVAGRATFEPFGARLASGPADPADPLRFAGARRQAATGLIVMGWRHYDPSLARFLEPDPVLAAVLDPQSLNRYAYARDNPLNLSDPDGHSPLAVLLLFGALALLDRDTRLDAAGSIGLTAASIFLTGALGPGPAAGLAALRASIPALYASAATTVIMDSRLGRGLVEGYAQLFEDLGMSDTGAHATSRLLSAWFLNSSLQQGFGRLMAPAGPALPGDALGDRASVDGEMRARGLDPGALGTPSGDAYGTTVRDVAGPDSPHELDRFRELRDAQGRVIGVYGVRDLGPFFDHGAAGILDGHLAAAAAQPHFAYGLGGISTQQVSRDLFAAGYSGSLFTLTGRTSDFLLELVYGPYGGGLAFGVGLAATAGTPAGAGP